MQRFRQTRQAADEWEYRMLVHVVRPETKTDQRQRYRHC